MSRKSKREIEKALEELAPEPDIHTVSDVAVLTRDMVDGRGNVIEDRLPSHEPPDGFRAGPVIPTKSPVVTWRKLIPDDGTSDT
jgi:hypothetical protein